MFKWFWTIFSLGAPDDYEYMFALLVWLEQFNPLLVIAGHLRPLLDLKVNLVFCTLLWI